jgi:hypothetical protein
MQTTITKKYLLLVKLFIQCFTVLYIYGITVFNLDMVQVKMGARFGRRRHRNASTILFLVRADVERRKKYTNKRKKEDHIVGRKRQYGFTRAR